jgi:hypothetical protein
MQQYQRPLNHWVMSAVLCAASGTSGAQSPVAPSLVKPDEPLPPRFVLCQREVNAQAGDRPSLMRTCLARRLEGERAVERDCKRQVGAVKGVQARQAALLSCQRQGLSVASANLPSGPAPVRRPAPVAAADANRAPSQVASVGAPARVPAAGEN